MPPWRALLVFPVRPRASAAALRLTAALAALGPPLFLFVYLWGRGCAAADAAAAGAGLLLLVAGLGAGGAVGTAAACRVVAGTRRPRPSVHFVFAAWTVVLFVAALLLAMAMELDAEAPLAAGLFALVWGVLAGMGLLRGADAGRSLVASCAGAGGALLGLVLAALVAREGLVMVVPAPEAAEEVRPGAPLLVRPGAASHGLVLIRDAGSERLRLVRGSALGPATKPVGRVFFRLGNSGG